MKYLYKLFGIYNIKDLSLSYYLFSNKQIFISVWTLMYLFPALVII